VSPNSHQNLLVFRFGQIGDTVAALPSLWVLRQQFPGARIVILSEIPAQESHLPPEAVLPQTGLVDGFEKYPGGASLSHFIAALRKVRALRKDGFSTLVYLMPSRRTKRQRVRDRLFFRLAGIKHIIGSRGFPETLRPRMPDGSMVPLQKEPDALLRRLKYDGLPIPDPGQGCLDLQITPAERERAASWWRQKTGAEPAGRAWVAVCTGGKTATQLWPWENYAKVVGRLINEHRLFPVIIGGNEDRPIAEKLLLTWKTGLCAAGELSVRESAALLAGARFYLGNDTGAMHLAAAVGTPCVGVFSGRNWPGIWEPYGELHQVLRHDVPCTGCRLAVCDQDLQCLKGIQVEHVYQACARLLARLQP
jgi:ADP-heptose:LPS heptosyltransferase